MSADWQISAGFLAELARPALYASAALASACVLADSRRRFRPHAAALWTAFTLFLPHVTLPLYLAACLYTRTPSTSTAAAPADANDEDTKTDDPSPAATTDTSGDTQAAAESSPGAPDAPAVESAQSPPAAGSYARPSRRHVLPLLYAAALLCAGAVYFYADYQSADAHLARARQAKLDGRGERALREYRAALRREDDPHVRKLLGVELSKAGRWEEALEELRAAERGGEADDLLPFHLATALSALGHADEAAAQYRKFLQSRLCAQAPTDWRCETARAAVALK